MAAIVLTFVLVGCSKKDDTETPPDEPVTYTVSYVVELSGDYTDLLITYFDPGNVKKELTSFTSPLTLNFNNFATGDSVYVNMHFKSVVDKDYSYKVAMGCSASDSSYVAPFHEIGGPQNDHVSQPYDIGMLTTIILE